MKDISAIKNMPIPSWFSGTEDRNGWEGLITEIRKMLDDNSVDLSLNFMDHRKVNIYLKNVFRKEDLEITK